MHSVYLAMMWVAFVCVVGQINDSARNDCVCVCVASIVGQINSSARAKGIWVVCVCVCELIAEGCV